MVHNINMNDEAKIEKELPEKYREEIIKVIEDIEDPTVAVLKMHLLTENLLERIILSFLPSGDKLIDKGRLSYSQKLILVDSCDHVSDIIIISLKI